MSHYAVYLWQDLDAEPNLVKFGETFLRGNLTPEQVEAATKKYVRESMGGNKNRFDEGKVVVHQVWDASAYAKKLGIFKSKSHLDDKIRNECLHSRVEGSEKHKMTASDAMYCVTEFLKKHDLSQKTLKLTSWQYDGALDVLNAINGKQNAVVLADWVARFGKTLASLAVFKESGKPRMVIASYVQTVNTSFRDEIGQYEQFKNCVFINSANPNYLEQISLAEDLGKLPIIYLSLCQSSKRQERLDAIFAPENTNLVVVDEADYGSHTASQVRPLMAGVKQNPRNAVILMTGTNPDRAASEWKVTHYSNYTYMDLLHIKNKQI
jgi:hypothetical protein